MVEVAANKKIILFDGVCNLCNSSIIFIIKRDTKDTYRFAALQSDIGKQLTTERKIDTSIIDSIILIEPGVAYYTKAEAAIKIGNSFGGFWSILGVFSWIPLIISNAVYDLIARKRYSWFGKKDSCMIPTPALKAKFLE
jgi:predicted DCC family thiol-disulfide oxidoreductase YuxK